MRQARKLSFNQEKKRLVIDVDLAYERLTKAGKSFLIYSTPGFFEDVEGTSLQFKLTVIRRFSEEDKEAIPALSKEEREKLQTETRETKL